MDSFNSIKHHLHDFLSSSSLHGAAHLSREDLSAAGRAFWAISLLLSFAAAAINIAAFLDDSAGNPVSTAMESVPAQEELFPAVSVDAGDMGNFFLRFQEEVFNNVAFDCVVPYESGKVLDDCVEMRMEVVRKYGPFIAHSAEKGMYWLQSILGLEGYIEVAAHELACPFTSTSMIKDARAWDMMWTTGMVLWSKENSTSDKLDHIPFLANLATKVWRLPPERLVTTWKEVLGALCNTTNLAEPQKTLGWKDCEIALKAFPHSVSRGLAAFSYAILDDRIPYSIGNMLTTGTFSRSLADFSSKMDTIQSDYERVLKSQGIEPPFLPEPYRGNGFILINAPKPNYGTDLFEGPEKSPKPESYKNLLRIMKYSKQAASKKVVDEGSIKTLAEALASLELPTVSKERLKHSYPRILGCRTMASQPMDYECPNFSSAFSTRGLAFTTNVAPFKEMYNVQSEADLETFWREMNKKSGGHHQGPPRAITNFGPSTALEFILQRPTFSAMEAEKEDASLGFRLSIHPPGEVPDLTNTQLLLKPGRAYTITFSLQETMSEEGLEQLSEEQRRCTFPHEKKDGKVTLFNNYTQSGCLFECTLRRASQECGCVPWDFPRLPDVSEGNGTSRVPVCNHTRAKCFEDIFSSRPGTARECQCLPACQSVEYDVTFNHEPINSETLCKDERFLRVMENRLSLALSGRQAGLHNAFMSCVRTLNQEATFVQVFTASGFFPRVTRSRRITPSGRISAIGGILSLFTGMSLLSLSEAAFWAAKILGSAFKTEKPKKKSKIQSCKKKGKGKR